MTVTFGSVVVVAGVCGILSFVFLAISLGTDYWYIIEMNPALNMSDLNSYSGLWRINEGGLRLRSRRTLIIQLSSKLLSLTCR